jgi:hypothetical protein
MFLPLQETIGREESTREAHWSQFSGIKQSDLMQSLSLQSVVELLIGRQIGEPG